MKEDNLAAIVSMFIVLVYIFIDGFLIEKGFIYWIKTIFDYIF